MGVSRACTRVGVLVCMRALVLQLACCELETHVYSRVFFKFDVDGTVNCHFSAIGQIFLHSHYEIFCSTGARRPFDEKPSHLGSWVLTPLTEFRLSEFNCMIIG